MDKSPWLGPSDLTPSSSDAAAVISVGNGGSGSPISVPLAETKRTISSSSNAGLRDLDAIISTERDTREHLYMRWALLNEHYPRCARRSGTSAA